jgi:hypothetical protein
MTVPSDPRQIYPAMGTVPGLRYLGDLDDVVITSPTDDQVLTFNTDHWGNADAAGGGGTADDANAIIASHVFGA